MKRLLSKDLRRLLLIVGGLVLPASFSMLARSSEQNPLFADFNEIVEFSKLTVQDVTGAADQIITELREDLQKIYWIPADARNFQNTMLVLDDISHRLNTTYGMISLTANTHPDSAIRSVAQDKLTVLSKFFNEITLDEQLYQAVKSYSQSVEARELSGARRRFLDITLRDFERNGFALPSESREELKKIKDRISELGVEFSKHIADYQDYLVVSGAETEGLAEDYLKSRKQEGGTYKIDLSYPSYFPFMRLAKSERARKELYFKYQNRAADNNLTVLDNLLRERQKMARLLGYSTFAAYQVEDKMAKSPQNVWEFENSLMEKLQQKARQDYAELLEIKRAELNDSAATVIQPWEASYYRHKLLKEKYQLDQEKLKEYFELNNVLQGLFIITRNLFDLDYQEIHAPSVWHPDVRLFEVKKNGTLIGRFYLDLYPRPNKYTHAACFPMITGRATENGYQYPTATLVCNFPEPTEDRPALMPHSQVITFFHEFGHVLHHILTTSELASLAGFAVAQDFVEAPSQMLENWVWQYESLRLFARHYQSGEILPKGLHDKMIATKNVGSGLTTLQQVYYGTLDMTLHDRFDPHGSESTTDIVKELQNDITLYPYLEGTHFQAAFGHLNGYAAGYYGYLWSRVYAADMFSVFEKNGIMDPSTGRRYRDIILAKGATEDELELVKQFLNREPDQEAFLKSIGL